MFFDYPGQASGLAQDDFVVFGGLQAADWEKLASFMREERFRAGDAVLRAGDDAPALYVLARGEVEVVAGGGLLGERRLAVIGEGSVFGEIGFFDRRPRSATVRARTDAVTLSLRRDQFDAMAVFEPRIAHLMLMDLGRVLSQRLRGMLEGVAR